MIKAYKYKIHPNIQQQELLAKLFGCCRYIYNWGLNRKATAYKEDGIRIGYNMLAKELTTLKQIQEYDWLNECPVVPLQQSLRNLDWAFTAFFNKKGKFPQFKSKRHSIDSAKFIQSVHFDFSNWRVKLPKLGWIELCENRTFDQSTCKQGICTVSRDKCGTYWCVIVVEDNKPKPTKTKLVKETAVGIDLGIKDYAILSDGTKFTNPKHLEQAQRKLSWLQRDFARTKKGSKNHEKMRIKVARCYRSIANQRNDFLHKLSTYLIENYDTICLEDLNVEGMEQNHHLARAIQGAAWGEFVRQLEYKSDWYGKNILFIDRFEPSSKTCSNCGYVNDDLKLSDRKWVCPNCGEHLDRDVNAATNIREFAFSKVLAVA